MSSTLRQRTYDHRLILLIQETGDATIDTGIGPADPVAHADFVDLDSLLNRPIAALLLPLLRCRVLSPLRPGAGNRERAL